MAHKIKKIPIYVYAMLVVALTVTQAFAQLTSVSMAGSTTAIVQPTATSSTAQFTAPALPKLTHKQEVWLSALAWCESHGNPDAINPIDRDGTASYGEYQFKPQTFKTLSKKYNVQGDIMDGNVQRLIVSYMLLDKKITTNEFRYTQFPDCIQKHIGNPPR